MLTVSGFFMLFLLCNVSNALHAMDESSKNVNYDYDGAEHYIKTKNLTKHKIERQKKHQNPQTKKKYEKVANIYTKKATK